MFFFYDSNHLRCYAVIQTTNQNINHQCHGKLKKKQDSNLVYYYAILTGVYLPAFRENMLLPYFGSRSPKTDT